MKKCSYCDMGLANDVVVCPYCASNEFLTICSTCGTVYAVGECPECSKRAAEREEAMRLEVQAAQEQAAVDAANTGLVWKTILTFCLPFIGAYFLVGPNVKTGRKAYALVWCVAFFLIGSSGSSIFEEDPIVAIITTLVFLGPVIYWLVGLLRKKKNL